MIHQEGVGHAEDKAIELTVDFDFEEVARDLGESIAEDQPESKLTEAEWQRMQGGLETLIRWIYQDPHHRNMDGIALRLIAVAWIVIKELQPLSLTEIARMYGRDKQSVGRQVADFKQRFPSVRNCHMKD